jgi:hypothetical protein
MPISSASNLRKAGRKEITGPASPGGGRRMSTQSRFQTTAPIAEYSSVQTPPQTGWATPNSWKRSCLAQSYQHSSTPTHPPQNRQVAGSQNSMARVNSRSVSSTSKPRPSRTTHRAQSVMKMALSNEPRMSSGMVKGRSAGSAAASRCGAPGTERSGREDMAAPGRRAGLRKRPEGSEPEASATALACVSAPREDATSVVA